jgi:hypothetical protein
MPGCSWHLIKVRVAVRAPKGRTYNLVMSLKSAALFALVCMILLTVVLALGFVRDISAYSAGAIAANAILVSLVHLLASLSLAAFLYVFHKTQA